MSDGHFTVSKAELDELVTVPAGDGEPEKIKAKGDLTLKEMKRYGAHLRAQAERARNDDMRGEALARAIAEHKLFDIIAQPGPDDSGKCFRCGKPCAGEAAERSDEDDDEADDDAWIWEPSPDPIDVLAYPWPLGPSNPNFDRLRYFKLCGSCLDQLGQGERLRRYVVEAWRCLDVIARTVDLRISDDDEEDEDR